MKDLISLHDLTSEEVKGLLELGLKLKREQKSGIEHHILKGKTLGMIFTKSSTRTRVSFEVGIDSTLAVTVVLIVKRYSAWTRRINLRYCKGFGKNA